MAALFGVKTEETQSGIVISSSSVTTPSLFEENFSSVPDLVPAMAVACAVRGVPGVFHGVAHLEHKESNRITALKAELQKINTGIEFNGETMHIRPGIFKLPISTFHTHNDHRLAMSLAAVCAIGSIELDDETVVAKSYPAYWQHLQAAGFVCN